MTTTQSTDVVKVGRRQKRSEKTLHNSATVAKYSISQRTGGRFSKLKPLFSKDEKYVFVCTKSQPRVYSASSGELIRTLKVKDSLPPPIVAQFIHPTNQYRLITVSLKGHLHIWDWTDGSLIQSLQLQPTTEVVSALLIGTTFIWTDGKHIQAARDFPTVDNIHPVSRLSVCYGLATNGEQIFAYGDKSVMIFRLRNGGHTAEHEYLTLPSSCTAFAVAKDSYAYSDSDGVIFVYPLAPFEKNKQTVPRKLHWHSTNVSALEYALDGEYLLSGGSEGVLVLWQLATSNKQYLPRLASTIETIAVSESSKNYAVKLEDNTLKIINATTLELRAEITGPRCTSDKLATVSQQNSLLMTTGTEIQIWEHQTGRTSLRFPVTPQTFAGRVRDSFTVNEATVYAVAVQGEWLATLDCWTSQKEEATEFGHTQPQDETYLKFWKWQQSSYQLVCRIDNPHGNSRSTQLISSNKGVFFTVGDDASVKVWRQKPVKKDIIGGGTQVVGSTWTCANVFRVTRAASNPKIALSVDGSVLALHTSDQTFLIDSMDGSLQSTLSGLSTGRVVDVGFVQHYLVIVGHKRLVVWDLLRSTVAYALRIPEATTEMYLSCGTDTFVLCINEKTKNTKTNAKFFIFAPTSAKPIYREKCARTLAVSWSPEHGFIQVTDDLEVVLISDKTSERDTQMADTTPDLRSTGISSMYRPIRPTVSSVVEDVDMQDLQLNTQKVTEIFDDPAKTLEHRFADLALLVLGTATSVFD